MRSLSSSAVSRKSIATAAARIAHKRIHATTRLPSSPLVLLITTLSITTFCPTLVRGRIPTPRSSSSVSTSTSPKLSSFDMAWRCSGSTNTELVKNMARAGLIESSPVMEAMTKVDRGFFLPEDENPLIAYQDSPQSIGYGATISAPHMHAMCLELLKDQLKPGATALDVGSGSGYLVAAMAAMAGQATPKSTSEGKQVEPASSTSSSSSSSSNTPSIFGIEHIKELVQLSHANLDRFDKNWRSYISVVKGDGRQGIAGKQFDAIHVGAAAPELPPALIEQLKPHGRLVIPVGEDGGEQYLLCVDKKADGTIKKHVVSGVRYVPLTDESKQRKSVR